MSDMEDGRIKRPRDEEGGEEEVDLPKRRRGEGPRIELRILMQSKNAGAIIGKGGANINRLRNDYKASVTVPDSNGPERVLSIGAELGTVLDMLLDILPEMEDSRNKRSDSESELRMIVHQSQAGCIIGRQGFKVKELREKTGANIKVYSTCCPNSTDRVVAITGKPKIVVGCIEEIIELLQQAPPKGPINPYDPSFSDEFLAPEYGGFITGDIRASKGLPRGAAPPPRGLRGAMRGRMGMEGFGMGGGMDFGRRGGMRGGMRGGKSFGGGMGGDMEPSMGRGAAFGRGGSMRNMNANNLGLGRGFGGGFGMQQDFSGDMTNLGGGQGMAFGDEECETTQVTIPKDLAGAIIGKGGSRITDIRRRSGAMIVIDEPLPGSNDRIISISGTPDQIQNAQYLLQMSVKQNSNKF
ncbi:heterogeneous nuclear ribonucleoprotein K-like isoform X1 [Biomphalaria glabrata]|uniref:Heterogeneous nuclear ribonucleoprotein K-like isoform X2 n=2 Tax=Biomphalaria TaxID=6525 RepID=A0A2C9JPR5_BIOGL|nr:heterogeneous nuclear ribonucleoprotein K-like isoform X2 [Biomphalaria glabrata]KAI8737901.1 heterogeneous nuclear ribonucleoprotein K isoform X1 [Biomphalaria glabrata]KAI8756274.1 heterogeneous nuclear ribonucleoprotein K-like isoform X1 [Biomphalaria glabrata]KAK0049022.1 heterogeneous nuclear ribonucleoprotein K-like isoform X1 [Biomphalaria pfeifferi]